MPMIMRSVSDIMAARQRNTLFVEFSGLRAFDLDDDERYRAVAARQRHFEWFEANGITWETAAPRGWLEGDSGIYLLHAEPDDPRISLYTGEFETAEGRSLDSEAYQMVIMIYEEWLRSEASRADD